MAGAGVAGAERFASHVIPAYAFSQIVNRFSRLMPGSITPSSLSHPITQVLREQQGLKAIDYVLWLTLEVRKILAMERRNTLLNGELCKDKAKSIKASWLATPDL